MYMLALVCRDTLGRETSLDVYTEFDTVPKALFTVFRCTFGDCSASSGVPIFPQVNDIENGGIYCLCFAIYTFFMTVGIFNIISAVFVNNIVDSMSSRCDDQLW